MRQVKVSLDDADVAQLENDANKAGRSLSEEIRNRLQASLRAQSDSETVVLLAAISRLTVWVERQTRQRPWHSHPAAIRVLQDAIVARLERIRGGVKDAEFTWDELSGDARRRGLVGTADQRTWGPALEAIDLHADRIEQGLVRADYEDLDDLDDVPPF